MRRAASRALCSRVRLARNSWSIVASPPSGASEPRSSASACRAWSASASRAASSALARCSAWASAAVRVATYSSAKA
ncbi:hypothetical protein [Paracoccus sphaerophysae]|uniref:hypothetical protein n=1 Tax=Paracoccus sphaerophysae TaxID=690417 RepID=UPI00056C4DFF|nr:hypothetical protein [Paracoccus sphaerophysae]